MIPVPRNSGTNFELEGVYVTGSWYIIHFYCLAVEAGFYSDVVECLPVVPATLVRFRDGTGKIFSFYDIYINRHAYTEYLKMNEVYSPLECGMFFYIVLTLTKMKIPTTSTL